MEKTTYKDSEVIWYLAEDQDGEYILVDSVSTPVISRGQGQARQCFKMALAEIRSSYPDKTVKICAEPQDATTTQEGLVSFYSSMGFRPCDEQGGSGVIMVM